MNSELEYRFSTDIELKHAIWTENNFILDTSDEIWYLWMFENPPYHAVPQIHAENL